MTEKIEQVKIQADKDLRRLFEEYFTDVLNDKEQVLKLYLNTKNLLIRTEKSDSTTLLVKFSMTKDTLLEQDKNNAMLYNCLTEQEKKSYLAKQNFCLENGDFMYYDVNVEMQQYVKSMFKASYKKYQTKLVKLFVDLVMNTVIIQEIFAKVESAAQIEFSDDEVLKRVKVEKDELHEKIVKLEEFMTTVKFTSISLFQQRALKSQLKVMKEYETILECRIENWFDKEEN